MSTTVLTTAEELLRIPEIGCRYELIAGELRKMPPASWEHGEVGGRLHVLLGRHVLEHKLGKVLSADTGFLLSRDPDTVRCPDIAFLRNDRLPAVLPRAAFWPGAPDLAVEVVSPGDTVREVDEKVRVWLGAGTQVVWVVNPVWRNVIVYRAEGDVQTLTEEDELSGDEVVPGFRCAVRMIFAEDVNEERTRIS